MVSIEEIQEAVIPVAKKYDISKVYLFGSVARNEETESSDIDLAIDLNDSLIKSLLDLSSFKVEIENKLDKNVDISEIKEMEKLRGIQSIFAEDFIQERVLLYDKAKIRERYRLHQ